MNKISIILGSSSPRRNELLQALTTDYEVIKPLFGEKLQPGEKADKYVLRNAQGKSSWIVENSIAGRSQENGECTVIISADTIVHLGGEILQKPLSREEAVSMLKKLSGSTHEVLTGVSIAFCEKGKAPEYHQILEKTQVTFTDLSDDDILRYVETGEPMDKAGAYGVQGKGAWMIREVNGSYTNVVGLPMSTLASVLKQKNVLPA